MKSLEHIIKLIMSGKSLDEMNIPTTGKGKFKGSQFAGAPAKTTTPKIRPGHNEAAEKAASARNTQKAKTSETMNENQVDEQAAPKLDDTAAASSFRGLPKDEWDPNTVLDPFAGRMPGGVPKAGRPSTGAPKAGRPARKTQEPQTNPKIPNSTPPTRVKPSQIPKPDNDEPGVKPKIPNSTPPTRVKPSEVPKPANVPETPAKPAAPKAPVTPSSPEVTPATPKPRVLPPAIPKEAPVTIPVPFKQPEPSKKTAPEKQPAPAPATTPSPAPAPATTPSPAPAPATTPKPSPAPAPAPAADTKTKPLPIAAPFPGPQIKAEPKPSPAPSPAAAPSPEGKGKPRGRLPFFLGTGGSPMTSFYHDDRRRVPTDINIARRHRVHEASEGTEKRMKEPNVGRPDTAPSNFDKRSKLGKLGNIKTKFIDEAAKKNASIIKSVKKEKAVEMGKTIEYPQVIVNPPMKQPNPEDYK